MSDGTNKQTSLNWSFGQLVGYGLLLAVKNLEKSIFFSLYRIDFNCYILEGRSSTELVSVLFWNLEPCPQLLVLLSPE